MISSSSRSCLLAMALALAVVSSTLPTNAQTPRWRLRRWTDNAPAGYQVSQVTDSGYQLGVPPQPMTSAVLRKPDGTFTQINNFAPRSIEEDGSVIGGWDRNLYVWRDGQYVESLGLPYTDYLEGGSYRPGRTGFIFQINFDPPSIDHYILAPGTNGYYSRRSSTFLFASIGGDGLIGGSMIDGNGLHQPAVYGRYGGFHGAPTIDGMIEGRIKTVTDSGLFFGIVRRQTTVDGIYGVWWDQNFNMTDSFFIANFVVGATSLSDVYGTGTDDRSVFVSKPRGPQIIRSKYWSPTTGAIDLDPLIEGLPSGHRTAGIGGKTLGGRATLSITTSGNAFTYGYYLEPVPEPASLLALGVGAALHLRRKKRIRSQ